MRQPRVFTIRDGMVVTGLFMLGYITGPLAALAWFFVGSTVSFLINLLIMFLHNSKTNKITIKPFGRK